MKVLVRLAVAFGLVVLCSLRPLPTALAQERLPLIDTDTLLYVDNRGLDRIFVILNDHSFRLVADPSEVNRSANAFPIPRRGALTIHVGAFIEPGGENYVRFASQGPAGADADLIVAPVFVEGQSEVAYRIASLEPVPSRFQVENFPNPFWDQTTIRYTIPENRISGGEVAIVIYDVLGRPLAFLEEGRRFPGTFRRAWRVDPGLASGLYFVRLRVDGRAEATLRMVRVR